MSTYETVESAGLIIPPTIASEDSTAVAPATATKPAVNHSESTSPVIDLPIGILPIDVIDVIAQHPGLELSTLHDLIEDRADYSVSARQRQTTCILLDLAVISYRTTTEGIQMRLHALETTWDPGDNQACAAMVQDYQRALRDAIDHYRRLLPSPSLEPLPVPDL